MVYLFTILILSYKIDFPFQLEYDLALFLRSQMINHHIQPRNGFISRAKALVLLVRKTMPGSVQLIHIIRAGIVPFKSFIEATSSTL